MEKVTCGLIPGTGKKERKSRPEKPRLGSAESADRNLPGLATRASKRAVCMLRPPDSADPLATQHHLPAECPPSRLTYVAAAALK